MNYSYELHTALAPIWSLEWPPTFNLLFKDALHIQKMPHRSNKSILNILIGAFAFDTQFRHAQLCTLCQKSICRCEDATTYGFLVGHFRKKPWRACGQMPWCTHIAIYYRWLMCTCNVLPIQMEHCHVSLSTCNLDATINWIALLCFYFCSCNKLWCRSTSLRIEFSCVMACQIFLVSSWLIIRNVSELQKVI